jgi:thiamine biosynthesis protein ThiS
MRISVHLHGILRDVLPPASKGRGSVDLPENATVADLLTSLGIERRVIVAVNGQARADATHPLQDGDQVVIYTPVGGGTI